MYVSFLYFLKRIVFVKRHVWFFRIYLLDGYGYIYCFLDNDAAGKRALEELGRKFGPRMHDMAPLYEGYKDLNDCLVKHLQDFVITDK